MASAWIIAMKDLRLRIRDRSLVIFGILVPLGLTLILTQIIGPAFSGGFDPQYGIVDLDDGPIAAAIEEALTSQGWETVDYASQSDAGAAIDDGSIDAAFVVPAGFIESAQTGAPTNLIVLGNPDATISTLIAESIARSFAARVGAVQLAVAGGVVAGLGDAATLVGPAQGLAAQPDAISIVPSETGTRQLDPISYYAVGMATFFLFFTVQAGVVSILEERQDGTLVRLLTAPISHMHVLVGKSLASMLTGLLSVFVLVVASTLLLGADWGGPVGVVVLAVAGVMAAMGVGLAVSSFARNAEQAGQFTSIVAVVLGLLGGVFFPLSQASDTFAVVSRFSPHYWLLRGFGDNAGAGNLVDVGQSAAMVLIFASVFIVIGYLRRNRLEATA
ncbi:MAG: ABC transporter permease [Acidimicrobiia bacterium]|nr:ABC transporter permease [Acidimicrobiia bacterium]